ncbi:MAG: hypothetical protein BHW55_02395 [Candidatus Melainabacteria bacterium 35_41]|nr:MAG: hypothetical protein BHW55_02395 [Candidatus Melainabacteria bacterium 35_41]
MTTAHGDAPNSILPKHFVLRLFKWMDGRLAKIIPGKGYLSELTNHLMHNSIIVIYYSELRCCL